MAGQVVCSYRDRTASEPALAQSEVKHKNTDAGHEQQIIDLEAENKKARASGIPLPTGFHAHLALLYAQIWKDDQVVQQLETKKTLFPESSGFMDFLLEKYTDQGVPKRSVLLAKIMPLLFVLLLGRCATHPPYGYTVYLANRPGFIVVLPVLNSSLEVAAGYTVLSRATYSLAEAGYYVFPVALVDEAFKQNGLTAANDIHNAPLHTLREILGAEAALYLEVT